MRKVATIGLLVLPLLFLACSGSPIREEASAPRLDFHKLDDRWLAVATASCHVRPECSASFVHCEELLSSMVTARFLARGVRVLDASMVERTLAEQHVGPLDLKKNPLVQKKIAELLTLDGLVLIDVFLETRDNGPGQRCLLASASAVLRVVDLTSGEILTASSASTPYSFEVLLWNLFD